MNKLNSIFKKVAELEKNAQEVKLGMHVELALVDDIKAVANKIKSEVTESNKMKSDALKNKKMFDDAILLKAELLKIYEANRNKYAAQLKENNALFSKLKAQAKELGLSIENSPIYKEYLDASKLLSELSDNNQSNWELISKY